MSSMNIRINVPISLSNKLWLISPKSQCLSDQIGLNSKHPVTPSVLLYFEFKWDQWQIYVNAPWFDHLIQLEINNMWEHTINKLSSKVQTHTSGTSKWFWFKSEFSDFVMRISASKTCVNYCFDKINRLYSTVTDRMIILSKLVHM